MEKMAYIEITADPPALWRPDFYIQLNAKNFFYHLGYYLHDIHTIMGKTIEEQNLEGKYKGDILSYWQVGYGFRLLIKFSSVKDRDRIICWENGFYKIKVTSSEPKGIGSYWLTQMLRHIADHSYWMGYLNELKYEIKEWNKEIERTGVKTKAVHVHNYKLLLPEPEFLLPILTRRIIYEKQYPFAKYDNLRQISIIL
jgi:hypothetical protein